MLETITETREIVFDLYLWFFSEKEEGLHTLQRKLRFELDSSLQRPRPSPNTLSADFESEYAEDKPGWVAKTVDIPDEETLWTWGKEITWQASPDLVETFRQDPAQSEWLLFSRIALEVEVTYQWDFDDEEQMENFSESIGGSIWKSLSLVVENLSASEFVLQAYDY